MRRFPQGTPRSSLTPLFKFIPSENYTFKVVKKGSGCEKYSKSTIKTPEQRQWLTKVFTVNFDCIPPFALSLLFSL